MIVSYDFHDMRTTDVLELNDQQYCYWRILICSRLFFSPATLVTAYVCGGQCRLRVRVHCVRAIIIEHQIKLEPQVDLGHITQPWVWGIEKSKVRITRSVGSTNVSNISFRLKFSVDRPAKF